MADSASLRNRRYRGHKQGDHSLCRHDRPYRARPDVVIEAPGEDFDPATAMRELAGRLAAAYQAEPDNAGLARELRLTLLAIPADAALEWDPIAELQREEWDARRRTGDS